MVICPSCQKPLHPRMNFCPSCQAVIPRNLEGSTEPAGPGAAPPTDPEAETLPMGAPPPLPPDPAGGEARDGEASGRPAAARDAETQTETKTQVQTEPQTETTPASAPRGAAGPEPTEPPSGRLGWTDTAHPRTAVAGEVARELAAGEAEVPPTLSAREFVRLEINFNRVLVEGAAATLDVRLSAMTLEPLLDVRLEIESKRALAESIGERLPALEPGRPALLTGEFEIAERSKGTRLLTCRTTFTQLGRRRTFEGKVPATILAEPTGTNVSLSLSEIGNQVVHGDGGNAGLGAENRSDVKLHDLVDFSKITTLNDLLGARLPDNWVTVPWRQIADEPTGARFIAPAFLRTVPPARVLTLTPVEADGRELPGGLPLRLVARAEFLIGRRRDACDLVAWFLPRDEDNDQLTRGISKVQVIGTAGAGGIAFQVCPDTNGAYFNGEALEIDGGDAVLRDQARLSLGASPGKRYRIDLQHYPAEGSPAPEAENHRFWPGPGPEEKPVTGCVVLRPAECPPAFRRCLWLFTEADFGSGEGNPITLPDSGLASSQGLFHHYRGCFWIENSADGRDTAAVRVNGQRLRAGELAPLADGITLELGAARFRVELTE